MCVFVYLAVCVCTCLSYQAELVNASNTHACTCMSVPLCALSVCACVCVYSCTHASKQIFTYVLCGRVWGGGRGPARRASTQAVNDIKTGDKEEERERGRTNLSIFNQYLSGAKRGTRSAEEEGGRGQEREEEKGKEEEEEGEEASRQ